MATTNVSFNDGWAVRNCPARRNSLYRRDCAGRVSWAKGTKSQDASGSPRRQGERDKRLIALLPLVKHMAMKMRKTLPAHVELDDLVGEGMLGLLDAAQKFDAAKKVKIESYARHRIRGAILDGLRNLDSVSRDLRKKNRKMEKALRDLQSRLGRPAEDEEMAQSLGVSLAEWHRSVQELHGAGIDWLHPLRAFCSRQVSEENLLSPELENQFDFCYRQEQREIVSRAIACLSERERRVVLLYHFREMTMKQIGSMLRIDESRVSQLHSAAIERLRLSVKAILERPRQASDFQAKILATGSNDRPAFA